MGSANPSHIQNSTTEPFPRALAKVATGFEERSATRVRIPEHTLGKASPERQVLSARSICAVRSSGEFVGLLHTNPWHK